MTQTQAPAVTLKRTFQAPRDLVFKAFTDAEMLTHWWGPAGFSATVRSVDARAGGAFDIAMHAPDGQTFEGTGSEYVEVTPTSRIVLKTLAFGGGLEARTTIDFADAEGGTEVSLQAAIVRSTPETAGAAAGMEMGWAMSLDKLDALVANAFPDGVALLLSRVFQAPAKLVFEAFTQGEHLAKWWGPKGMDLHVERADVRPGGQFLYKSSAPGGEMWGVFDYREVRPSDRLVYVSAFSNAAGEVVRAPFSQTWPLTILNVMQLTERGGMTILAQAGGPVDATAEERATFEGMRAGMQGGFKGTFDQLEAYLAELQG